MNGLIKWSWLAGLILLLVFSSAEARIILADHEINLVIDEEGWANFNEKYSLVINRLELGEFLNNVEENGKNIMEWRIDYDFISMLCIIDGILNNDICLTGG